MIQTRDSVSCNPWGPDGEAYRLGGLHDAVSRRAGSGASQMQQTPGLPEQWQQPDYIISQKDISIRHFRQGRKFQTQ